MMINEMRTEADEGMLNHTLTVKQWYEQINRTCYGAEVQRAIEASLLEQTAEFEEKFAQREAEDRASSVADMRLAGVDEAPRNSTRVGQNAIPDSFPELDQDAAEPMLRERSPARRCRSNGFSSPLKGKMRFEKVDYSRFENREDQRNGRLRNGGFAPY